MLKFFQYRHKKRGYSLKYPLKKTTKITLINHFNNQNVANILKNMS